MSYLNFVSAGTSESGKTQLWTVCNLQGSPLGHISWFSAWRRYTFFPDAGTTFDVNCLREIAIYLEAETFRQQNKTAPTAGSAVRKPNCF